MGLKKGDKAPAFTLKDTDGNDVALTQYAGKPVVLLFFPLAFTGVCTKELCLVRDEFEMYEQLDAQILAISVDSFFTLQKFKQEQNLNFPLLSDFNKEVAEAYDAIYDEFFGMKGVAKRSAFVVSATGEIAYAEVLEKASDLPDFEAIKSTIKSM
ncbi:MAG: redoxin domain-containing protein [Bacteroidetes bacterium]|nr:redoxin domain-containing protein [Bacteroidota bacterium]MCH8523633.1 redoxin domain-containing protein [Balneolales bacterium]